MEKTKSPARVVERAIRWIPVPDLLAAALSAALGASRAALLAAAGSLLALVALLGFSLPLLAGLAALLFALFAGVSFATGLIALVALIAAVLFFLVRHSVNTPFGTRRSQASRPKAGRLMRNGKSGIWTRHQGISYGLSGDQALADFNCGSAAETDCLCLFSPFGYFQ
jgi:hypothetical protein